MMLNYLRIGPRQDLLFGLSKVTVLEAAIGWVVRTSLQFPCFNSTTQRRHPERTLPRNLQSIPLKQRSVITGS
jgi:hypothetical protein